MEKRIFRVLLGALFLLAVLYVYFVHATISAVVARQNLENKASSLTLSLSQKEFQYIGMKNNVTLSLAHSLGFQDILPNTFVSRDSGEKVAFLPR